MKSWDIGSIIANFVFALSLYLVCAAAAPEVPEHGAIDLDAFYSDNRRLFWGLLFLSNVAALWVNSVFLKVDPKLVIQTDIDTVPFLLICVPAFAISRPWAQWTSGLGLLAVQTWWTVTFSSSLQ